ncbi:general transcription factor [Lithospermum erythrorhizon]|uniref:General transcription factor n=1 Tax=Lithospermum erythrorhizon TaxID=34254 RepID=A0AAV3Q1H6_LITER
MEEQFILRVPPSIAEQIERLLTENESSSEEKALELSFSDDGRTGSFTIGNDSFAATLSDLPGIVESYKTYDDNVLIKTADIGQMIKVREDGDNNVPEEEYRHGLTPAMRDARRRRFRRETDLNPELVNRVERDLMNIMAGGTSDILFYQTRFDPSTSILATIEQEEDGDGNAPGAKKGVPKLEQKLDIQVSTAGDPDRTDSDDSDDSI